MHFYQKFITDGIFQRLCNLYNTVYKKITYRENFSFPILNFVFLFTIMYIFYKRKNRANDKSNAILSKKEEISAIFP